MSAANEQPIRGVDVCVDIAHSLPNWSPNVILDVGAHVGESAAEFLRHFPAARLICFEPVEENHRKLTQQFASVANVECFRVAVAAENRTGTMILRGSSDLHQLSPKLHVDNEAEAVEVVALTSFCLERDIDHVGFLKVDTEGGDLSVLEGAIELIGQQRIDFIQVEVAMNASNPRHVPMRAVQELLESLGYLLFGIYNQVPEWPKRKPNLRRANLVFVSGRVVDGA